jgi:hypothetical protein
MENKTSGEIAKQQAERRTKPDIGNLGNCIKDIKKAALDNDPGPKDPTNYSQLRGRLESSREKLPPLYRKNVFEPFTRELGNLGQEGFSQILLDDPRREMAAGLMMDIAHSILQNGEGYNEKATDSFQEVISDLYAGFLSAEDRKGVKLPDKGAIPPLVKWGNPNNGPYTWPVDATNNFGVRTGIVNLPPANSRGGLFAWAALGHETAGHDILHADTGLSQEMANAIYTSLHDENIGHKLPEYWATRIDETASDVMGILNMGPSAAIGLIGFFRGLNFAYSGEAKLRNEGPEKDPHPADILRGYLASYTVNMLSFSGSAEWAKIIDAETDRDLSTILIQEEEVDAQEAKNSAKIVAKTLINAKMESLDNHHLGEIQNWRNRDETIVNKLRTVLTMAGELPSQFASGIYAAHVVAAAVVESVSRNADIPMLFDRMIGMLKIMHDSNPSWGPLYVVHPGDIVALPAYYNHKEKLE